MRRIFITAGMLLVSALAVNAQSVSGFEDVVQQPDTFWNGSDLSRGAISSTSFFHNNFNPDWQSWSGFSVSSETDTVTQSWTNQYSCISGSGAHGSLSYGVMYSPGHVTFTVSPQGEMVHGVMVNNSTYAYRTMQNGDAFAKKFGGSTGTDPDWLKAKFYGYDVAGDLTDTVSFYLADFRSGQSAQDYIVKDWTWVDLSSLGKVASIAISISGTDMGQFGLNTPAYLCLDSLVRDSSSALFSPITHDFTALLPFNANGSTVELIPGAFDPDSDDHLLVSGFLHSTSGAGVSFDSLNHINYSAASNFNGRDTVTYHVCDNLGLCDTSKMYVLVNDSPVANDDRHESFINSAQVINVLHNDVDERMPDVNVSLKRLPAHGSAFFNANNEIEFLPDLNFTGNDTCTYLLCDAWGACDSAYITMVVKENATGLSEVAGSSEIHIFPNPASVRVQIQLRSEQALSVFSPDGKIILERSKSDNHSISVESWPEGVYFIQFSGGEVQRFLKE
jgi:hypothetical protein